MNKEERIVRFNKAHVTQYLKDIGHIPLPPYIKRQDNEDDGSIIRRFMHAMPDQWLHRQPGFILQKN